MTSEAVLINGQNSVRTFEYNNQGLRTLTRVNGFVAVQNPSLGAEGIDSCPDPGVRPWRWTSRSVLECGSALPLFPGRGGSGPQGGSVCTPSSHRHPQRRVRSAPPPHSKSSATPGASCDTEHRSATVTYATYYRTELVKDGLNRLRFRKEYNWQYGNWYGPMSQTRYLYDGMLVLQERNPTAPTVSYVRGLDLSGTLQGAGGIGGLLARARHATTSPHAINGLSYYHADGNGNVTYLAGSTGTADAAYKYDPFGRTLASTGSYAAANVYRFSSKAFHAPSGLYYYGYRFYDPNTQRWLNRDPIGEFGRFQIS